MTNAKAGVAPKHPDPEVVRQAEEIFDGVQMTPEQAIATFYELTALRSDGIRADELLNAESPAALGERRKSIVIYTIVDEMMADLWEGSCALVGDGANRTEHVLVSPAAGRPGTMGGHQAETIFAQMGMTPDEAIAVFYERTARHEECLLCLAYGKTFNADTLADLRKNRAELGIRKYANLAEMRAEMDQDAGTPH